MGCRAWIEDYDKFWGMFGLCVSLAVILTCIGAALFGTDNHIMATTILAVAGVAAIGAVVLAILRVRYTRQKPSYTELEVSQDQEVLLESE
jgi:hypothetical protein